MRNYLIILLFIVLFKDALGQGLGLDSCQCRLIYWTNIYTPILVTFHHDSLVSYDYAKYPKDSTFKMFGKLSNESILKIENFVWYNKTQTYHYNKEGIAEKINGEFYIFHHFKRLKTGIKFSSYEFNYSELKNDSVLYKDAYEITSHYKINGTICNCFNSYRYVYEGDYKKLSLSKKSFENIKTINGYNYEDENSFIEADLCTFGIFKTCNLTGIGPISFDILDVQSSPKSKSVGVIFLDSKCKDFYKKKLNLEIQQRF